MATEFLVLGQLRINHGGTSVNLGRRRERSLLGVLLLEPGSAVTTDRLVDLLWDGDPPDTARESLYTHVARLRARLDPDGAGRLGIRLVKEAGGYRVDLSAEAVDAVRFRRLVERAGAVLEPEVRAALLRDALALWRGPILANEATPRLRERVGAALTEMRLAAAALMVDAELACGRHEAAIGDLTALTAEYPHREQFVSRLMIALYRSGRGSEALQVYQRVRQLLAADLGVDPGPELQRLHTAMLRHDSALIALSDVSDEGQGAVAAPPVAPRQLPPDIATFTGREATLRDLDQLLPQPEEPPVLVLISGSGGMGKTALAVHWGHSVADRFPHGQLFVDLRGYSADDPIPPAEVLSRFLFALNARVPVGTVDVDALTEVYRSVLAGRRMLIVLDNAISADQVRPLLPGSAGSLVLVTTRGDLRGLVALNDARPMPLDVLEPAASAALLTRILGAAGVDTEPGQVAELAALCTHLPLALRIAAANVIIDPRRSIGSLVEQLRSVDRLGILSAGPDPKAAVRTVFDHSYARLAVDARQLFRLLGTAPGDDLSITAAAVLAQLAVPEAEQLLDTLTAAHLVHRGEQNRIRLHDLIRLYAREKAEAEDAAQDRAAALRRLSDYYLDMADAAARALYPGILRLPYQPAQAEHDPAGMGTRNDALAWLDVEHHNLIATVHNLSTHGPYLTACRLVDALRGYLTLRRSGTDWRPCTHAGLVAAEAAGDRHALAAMQLAVATAQIAVSDFQAAVGPLRAALAEYRHLDLAAGEAAALGNLSTAHRVLGRLDQALEDGEQALAVYRRIDAVRGEALALGNVGQARHDLGQLDKAAEAYTQALACFRSVADQEGEANALNSLGLIHHDLGELPRALDCFQRALAMFRRAGVGWGEATALDSVALVQCDLGRPAKAFEMGQLALAVAREAGYRRTEANARNSIATAARALGLLDEAIREHLAGLRLAREIGWRHAEIDALAGLAATRCQLGDLDAAISDAEAGLARARESGLRIHEGHCLTALADGHLRAGNLAAAAEHGRQALAVHQAARSLLGRERTLRILAAIETART